MLSSSPPRDVQKPSDQDLERLGHIAAGKHALSMMLSDICDELEKIAKEQPADVRDRILGQVARIARVM